ncbi:RNPS1 [Lepeophtheirus salmonis]|uniref:RNPS1 n=1 Tax=Lepeophtheirus salmonis TaxID=72036 RepID=A0A7R8CRU9_LEPSM|nr:RNPS1 [Lepeophtheirus salmonis]CAF2871365.1 RNPS1 [Lepeophtheirus salmonis]
MTRRRGVDVAEVVDVGAPIAPRVPLRVLPPSSSSSRSSSSSSSDRGRRRRENKEWSEMKWNAATSSSHSRRRRSLSPRRRRRSPSLKKARKDPAPHPPPKVDEGTPPPPGEDSKKPNDAPCLIEAKAPPLDQPDPPGEDSGKKGRRTQETKKNGNNEERKRSKSPAGLFPLFDPPRSVAVPSMVNSHPWINRGYAYVDYDTHNEAKDAIKHMAGGQIDGQEVTVELTLIASNKVSSGGPPRRQDLAVEVDAHILLLVDDLLQEDEDPERLLLHHVGLVFSPRRSPRRSRSPPRRRRYSSSSSSSSR